ncbi:MAG: hypothetical protein JNL82_29410 [Myxococcales bacterium]|nr:hypothetical protein [Myxococcales bacterium]
MALFLALAAVLGACSQPNPNHCANQEGDVKGDNYCKSISVDTPHCSRCIADNNGCVAEPVTDETCEVGSTSVGEATTAPPTSSSSTTTGGDTSTTGTSEPVTASSSTTGTTAEPTTTASTTTTGDSSTSTTGGDSSTGTSTTDTGDSSSGSTGTSTGTTGDTDTGTSETTMDGPMCGDNLQEDPEVCDGADLDGFTCVTKNPSKYSGGQLKCSGDCNSYDETGCCLALGVTCDGTQPCCNGKSCVALGCGLNACCK